MTPMTAREARLQVDADRDAGRTTPHEVLVLASGDRTVEPVLDGRGQPVLIDDLERAGQRPVRLAEAKAVDAWACDTAKSHGHHPDRDDEERG